MNEEKRSFCWKNCRRTASDLHSSSFSQNDAGCASETPGFLVVIEKVFRYILQCGKTRQNVRTKFRISMCVVSRHHQCHRRRKDKENLFPSSLLVTVKRGYTILTYPRARNHRREGGGEQSMHWQFVQAATVASVKRSLRLLSVEFSVSRNSQTGGTAFPHHRHCFEFNEQSERKSCFSAAPAVIRIKGTVRRGFSAVPAVIRIQRTVREEVLLFRSTGIVWK